MYEIGIMNPRGKKRRRKARASNPKRKTRMARRRNAKGRFVKARSNPRRKRRHHNPHRKHARARRRKVATVVVKANPRRRHRRHNPRRHYRARHRRSNPMRLPTVAGLMSTLQEGAIEGAGGLANSVALGFILPYLPATFTTGYALHGVRILNAALLAYLGKNFGGRIGGIAGRGAVAVAMFQLFRDLTVSMAPTLPLGDYEEIALTGVDSGNIAGYMDPATTMGAYMHGRRLPDGSRGMGAYMQGMRADMEQTDSMSGTDY
jgi:hypothetical protein